MANAQYNDVRTNFPIHIRVLPDRRSELSLRNSDNAMYGPADAASHTDGMAPRSAAAAQSDATGCSCPYDTGQYKSLYNIY